MKKLLVFLLLIPFLSRADFRPEWISDFKYGGATPNNPDQTSSFRYLSNGFKFITVHNIGTGSGTWAVTSMSGIGVGDIFAVKAGTYGHCQISNMGVVTFQPATTSVTFTSSMAYSDNHGTTIDGSAGDGSLTWTWNMSDGKGVVGGNLNWIESGVTGSDGCFELSGSSSDINFKGIQFVNCDAALWGNQNNQTFLDLTRADGYNIGYYPNKKWVRGSVKYIKTNNCHSFMFSFRDYNINIMDSVEWAYIRVDQMQDQTMIATAGQQCDIHDWYLGQEGAQAIANNIDRGVFQIGPSKIHNIKWVGNNTGWLLRTDGGIDGSGFGIPHSRWLVYNNMMIGHTHYGMADVRINVSKNTTALHPCSIYAYNNTYVNASNNQGFVQTIINTYGMEGDTCYGRNNVRANILDWVNSGNGQVTSRAANFSQEGNMQGAVVWDTSGPSNKYIDAALTWFTDTINCIPSSGSALRHAAVATVTQAPIPSTDIYGKPQPESGQSATQLGAANYFTSGGSTVTANSGTNQVITKPTSSLTIDASASSSSGSTITSYAWSQTSGPSSTISNSTNATTTVTGMNNAGTYVYKVVVTDALGSTGNSSVTETVNSLVTASAGSNRTITLPTTLTLDATASSSNGSTISTYAWTKTSGGAVTFGTPSASTTTVSGLSAGSYTFHVVVTDAWGSSASANVTITVNSSVVASAGNSQTITLPTSSLTLDGTGSTSTGSTISTYAWTQTAGPTSTITSPSGSTTTVTGMTAGSYTFHLVVTDATGVTASSNVSETVNPAVVLPACLGCIIFPRRAPLKFAK